VNRVIRSPGEYMQPASDAVSEVARNLDPKFLKEGERVMVGFSGPFGFHRVTPRDLMSSFIGTMVCVEGIVTKCNVSFPFSRWTALLLCSGSTHILLVGCPSFTRYQVVLSVSFELYHFSCWRLEGLW
jgi:DNA replicative helicase MCM subunit Mcm2 (Cdc46/Mcm family)